MLVEKHVFHNVMYPSKCLKIACNYIILYYLNGMTKIFQHGHTCLYNH